MPRGGKRERSGRKPGVTIPTRVKRIPTDLSDEMIDNLPELRALFDHWEEKCVAAGEDAPRYHFLREFLSEARGLGY